MTAVGRMQPKALAEYDGPVVATERPLGLMKPDIVYRAQTSPFRFAPPTPPTPLRLDRSVSLRPAKNPPVTPRRAGRTAHFLPGRAVRRFSVTGPRRFQRGSLSIMRPDTPG